MSRITVTFVSNRGLCTKSVSVDIFDTINDVFEFGSPLSPENDFRKSEDDGTQNQITRGESANKSRCCLHSNNNMKSGNLSKSRSGRTVADQYVFCYNGKIVDPLMTFHYNGFMPNKDGQKIFVCRNGRSDDVQTNREKLVFNDIKEYRKKIFLSLPENKEKVAELMKRRRDSVSSPSEKDEKGEILNEDIYNLFSNDEKTGDFDLQLDDFDLQFDDFDLQLDDFNERLKKQKINEILKINDQIWATWETSKTHSKVIRFMMKKIEQQQKEEEMNDNSEMNQPDSDRKSAGNQRENRSSSWSPNSDSHSNGQMTEKKQKHINLPLNLEKATEISCKPLPICFGKRSMNSHAILMAEYPPSTDCESTSTAQNFDLD